jgi:pimeloyl-ACP methyl ester carboxylesterase
VVKLYFDDANFDGQLQRTVGKADSGMANVGECLSIAERIVPGDRESWYAAWSEFADHLTQRGDQALHMGHTVSARNAYLRAAEYYRQAFFFHRDDLGGKKLKSAYGASVEAFRAALPLLDAQTRVLPGGLSGYLFTPTDAKGPQPTILHIGGYDGTAEELYAAVYPALARGYTFVAVDGPGQGALLYERGIPMRPDWENVVPGMLDSLRFHPEVDADRVVLVGRSFGGVLAPRGAAGEHRLAALIVDPGQFDIGAAVAARLGPLAEKITDPASDQDFTSLLDIPGFKAFLTPRMATHGVGTVREYFVEVLRYSNAETATQISCPTLVTDNETDEVSSGQGKVLFDHLSCDKEFRLFTKAEGAEGHCEGMAPTVFWDAAYDWLDTLFA